MAETHPTDAPDTAQPAHAGEPLTSRAFRDACGCFATGVTIITARAPTGAAVGMTINSLTSVSLDPPLILFCLMRASENLPAFAVGRPFACNMLRADQRALSKQFSRPVADRFQNVPFAPGANGAPLLSGCLAHMEGHIHSAHPGGDHVILVGRVARVRLHDGAGGSPLVYYRGTYTTLGTTLDSSAAEP